MNGHIVFRLFLIISTASYNICVVRFVYQQWSHDFPFYIQLLEIFPTLALGLQALCQSFFQLFASTCPFAILNMEDRKFLQLIDLHVVVNFGFSFHALSMLVVMTALTMGDRNNIMGMSFFEVCALLEVFFRLYSTIDFRKIAKRQQQVQKHVVPTSNNMYTIEPARIGTDIFTVQEPLVQAPTITYSRLHPQDSSPKINTLTAQETLNPLIECAEAPAVHFDIHPQATPLSGLSPQDKPLDLLTECVESPTVYSVDNILPPVQEDYSYILSSLGQTNRPQHYDLAL